MTMRQVDAIMSAPTNEKTGGVVAGRGWNERPPRSKRELHALDCRRRGVIDEDEIERLWKKSLVTRNARGR